MPETVDEKLSDLETRRDCIDARLAADGVPTPDNVFDPLLADSLFSRLAEPGALVPLAGQKRICTKTALPSDRGYRNLQNWA